MTSSSLWSRRWERERERGRWGFWKDQTLPWRGLGGRICMKNIIDANANNPSMMSILSLGWAIWAGLLLYGAQTWWGCIFLWAQPNKEKASWRNEIDRIPRSDGRLRLLLGLFGSEGPMAWFIPSSFTFQAKGRWEHSSLLASVAWFLPSFFRQPLTSNIDLHWCLTSSLTLLGRSSRTKQEVNKG